MAVSTGFELAKPSHTNSGKFIAMIDTVCAAPTMAAVRNPV